MKRCQQCNFDFEDSLRFCLSCGAELVESIQSTPIDRERFVRCRTCKNFVREDAAVCEHCGASMQAETAPMPPPHPELPPTQYPRPKEWYGAPDPNQGPAASADSQDWRPAPPLQPSVPPPRIPTPTSPTRNEKTAPSLSMLESYGASNTPEPSSRGWYAALLGLFFLLFVGALGAGGWYWWSHRASDTQSGPRTDSGTSTQSTESSTPSSTATPASGRMNASSTADDELKQLRERRINAPPSEAASIIAAFEAAEKKYPNDYRFPYERAKLSIKGITSHHEAFGALSLAGEKAIDNGKAQEMLNNLTADKDGDFYKLSRGHREWQALEEALRNNDKAALKTLHH